MGRQPLGPTYAAFGDYVRNQRQLARLSLRQAAALARISNPYLSQIEHGLALPSVTVIRGLADALHVSADNLMHLAAGTSASSCDTPAVSTEDAIRHDPRLDAAQKHALLAVLTTFVAERSTPPTSAPAADAGDGAAPAVPITRRRHAPRASTQDRGPDHD